MDLIFEKVKRFLVKETGVREAKIMLEAALEKDLGISGDDAWELIFAFSEKFSVDISSLDIGKYFNAEGDSILPEIIRSLSGKKPKKQGELTVANLVKAATVGRLDEEIIKTA